MGYSTDRATAVRSTFKKLEWVQKERTKFNRGASDFLKEKLKEIEEVLNRTDFSQIEMKYVEEGYEAVMKGWGLPAAENLKRQYRPR